MKNKWTDFPEEENECVKEDDLGTKEIIQDYIKQLRSSKNVAAIREQKFKYKLINNLDKETDVKIVWISRKKFELKYKCDVCEIGDCIAMNKKMYFLIYCQEREYLPNNLNIRKCICSLKKLCEKNMIKNKIWRLPKVKC